MTCLFRYKSAYALLSLFFLLCVLVIINSTYAQNSPATEVLSADCSNINDRITRLKDSTEFDVTIYQNLAAACPKNFSPWFNYGVLLLSKNKFSEAKVAFERSLSIKNDQEAVLALGFAEFALEETKLARQRFESILNKEPENIRALQGLAEVEAYEGSLDKAYNILKKTIEIDPENPTSYFNLAAVENKRQDLARAKIALHKTLELNPEYPLAALQLARLYRKEGKVREALTTCKQALNDKANAYLANNLMADIYLDLNDYEQSAYWFSKSLKTKPSQVDAILGLAKAYNGNQRSSEALNLLIQNDKIKEEATFDYLKVLGSVYMNLGKFLDARNAFEEALVLQPHNSEIIDKLKDVALTDRK